MSAKRFPGTIIVAGSEKLLVPALSLRQFTVLSPKLASLSKLKDFDGGNLETGVLEDVIEIVHTAISRNYPDYSLEQVGEIVDMRNMAEFLGAATGTSAVSQGEEDGAASP